MNYDVDGWRLLTKQLLDDPTKIHVLNRAQFIDDIFTFACDKKVPYKSAFELGKYLSRESHPTPWSVALEKIYNLYNQYAATSVAEPLKVDLNTFI